MKFEKILKILGEKCTECGEFFIGVAITASTEDGNYGIYFNGIEDYPLNCGKCPNCAEDCYAEIFDYINENGCAPCYDDELDDDEDFSSYIKKLDCYPYTDDYQDYILQLGSGHIDGGQLIDITEIILKRIK